jgi:putative ABC transport system permease protein
MIRDLKEGLRSVASNPGPAAVVIATLALAIGANTSLFSVLNGVLLRPLGYPDPEELVILWGENRERNIEGAQLSTADFVDIRERARSFDGSIAAYRYLGFTLTGIDRPERLTTVQVAVGLFQLLGVDAELGRTFVEADETPGNERLIILSNAFWVRYFGSDPAIIDSTVLLDGEPATVIGVMPEGFTFPAEDPGVEVWSPLTLSEAARMERAHRMFSAIGRLAPGTTLAAARQELDAIAAQIAVENPETNGGWGLALVAAHEELIGDLGSTLWVLFGAVTLVLLIGCANVANVLIARSSEVAKDYVIRSALGAGKLSLMRRSLAESLVLAAAGGFAGLLLALWGSSFLRSVIPHTIPRADQIGIDANVLAFTVVVTLASGILFGLLPALRVTTYNLAESLQSGTRGSSTGRRARVLTDAMIVLEVALALMLLTGAGLMMRGFSRLSDVDPGFRKDGVVSVMLALPASRSMGGGFENNRQFFTELVDRVKSIPGVESAGAVTRLPMSGLGIEFEMPFSVVALEAESPTERPRADYRGVIPEYLSAMGIPLIEGRLFDDHDGQEGREVTLINRAVAERYFPDRNPIGQVLRMPMAGDLEIVGIVGDVRHGGLQSEIRPEIYVPFRQMALGEMHIVVHSTEDPARIAAAVGEQITAMDPDLAPTEVATISDLLYESIAQPRFYTALLAGLAICAALLAAVGIYGVVAYSVVQRSGEIGIRMALGADAAATIRLVVGQAMAAVTVGVVIGWVGALGMARLIEGVLYGIEATDPLTYVVVGLLVIGLGTIAAAIPARRATRVDPVDALRQE